MIEVDIEKRIKGYPANRVIKVAAVFNSGSVTQILGPSGVGKTTLLKMIAGLISTERGFIKVANLVWLDTEKGIDLSPQVRKPGFVFQDYALFPNMTVIEHLRFGSSDEAYIERLLKAVELEDLQDRKPFHLSGGQQQRLAIVRALSTKPLVLLMDEPFSALDSALKATVAANVKMLIKELAATALVVTHHPFEAADFADSTFEML